MQDIVSSGLQNGLSLFKMGLSLLVIPKVVIVASSKTANANSDIFCRKDGELANLFLVLHTQSSQ